ncbi:DUF3991 and TOPRIM domain-containing protein [Falsiroseomonas tokyonensis]|uniref:DUF3991 domain-containing protein n=1 Tax=Falsiroseomonas tokyonensis TaxID=430521 RepID=A0ABV7C513_9PROT|nr:DUF3991 and TOPRIM domain-containing protein [Falsiroseomonas tokyonensis]MBU8541746.1 DUF3991 and TOPRIM domain-containing protein [Falsiroseomonas tokyonensis]
MAGYDNEIDALRARVDCRTVLERAGWQLDIAESTRRAVKYRLGAGRIVIVTHEGRGWFDPLGSGRGDVLALAQHVWGGTLGHARQRLRPLAGIAPSLQPAEAAPKRLKFDPDAWHKAPPPRVGSAGWRYLIGERGLPASTVSRVVAEGCLREGILGTGWGAHADAEGRIVGWEMRGPRYKGFVAGGTKAIFAAGAEKSRRLVVCEGMIDALSLASLEGWRECTRYVSTGGGWRDAAIGSLRTLLVPGSLLVAATDRGTGGERLAERLAQIAAGFEVAFERLLPANKDWNDDLRAGIG